MNNSSLMKDVAIVDAVMDQTLFCSVIYSFLYHIIYQLWFFESFRRIKTSAQATVA
jgi:hypothetical protein